jgi:hypothetical protein
VLGRLPIVLTAAALCGLVPCVAGAQTELTLELGASQIGPPLALDSESARFGVAGVRASHYSATGSGASVSVLAGRTLGGSNGGDFLTFTAGGTVASRWSAAWGASFDGRLVAFGVRAPYPYRAIGVEGGPTLEVQAGPAAIELSLIGGVGQSRIDLWRVPGGRTRVFTDQLWRAGVTADILLGSGPVRVGAAGGIHDTPAGTLSSGGGRVLLSGDWGAAEVRADMWRTPSGTEATAGIAMVVPLSAWSLRAFFGRSEPDPLTLSEPGRAGGGILVGHNLIHRDPGLQGGPQPYAVLAPTEGGARVRIEVRAPAGTRGVELVGDFTLWEAVPMQSHDDDWVVEVDVKAGTHHYGFLVDGEWYLPDDIRDVVPDEWGRASAILVIEGDE